MDVTKDAEIVLLSGLFCFYAVVITTITVADSLTMVVAKAIIVVSGLSFFFYAAAVDVAEEIYFN